jgi:putative FmdB family regulatory protein
VPIYQFKCNKCQYDFEKYEKLADSDLPTRLPCPGCQELECVDKVIGSPAIVSGVNFHSKVPNHFRDRMKDIKKMNPGSTIDV